MSRRLEYELKEIRNNVLRSIEVLFPERRQRLKEVFDKVLYTYKGKYSIAKRAKRYIKRR